MSVDASTVPEGPEIDPDQMMTIGEVARMLRLSPTTIKRWLAHGTAPKHYRVGASVRFYRQDVTEFVRSGQAAEARTQPSQIAAGE